MSSLTDGFFLIDDKLKIQSNKKLAVGNEAELSWKLIENNVLLSSLDDYCQIHIQL